jgi:hypothetical protein
MLGRISVCYSRVTNCLSVKFETTDAFNTIFLNQMIFCLIFCLKDVVLSNTLIEIWHWQLLMHLMEYIQ